MNITIKPELKALIPPLAEEERKQLETNIKADGCREPLVVWNDILIDGHNRYEICTRNDIAFEVVNKHFDNQEQAEDWMDTNQLGRRNLSPDNFALLIGRRYNRTKKDVGSVNQHTVARDQSDPQQKTADKLADDYGISAPTIKRAGQFADAVEKLGIAEEVAKGEVEAPRKQIVEIARALPASPTTEQVEEAKKHIHVSHNSGNNEWYTPKDFIDAARESMGNIDLDPASSDIANQTVQADKYFTKDDDGLAQEWNGKVWMNPPYAQPLMGQFADKMKEQVEAGNVQSFCVLVNNATETKWFKTMASVADYICFTSGRVKFLDPEGNKSGAPLQGQAILIKGNNYKPFSTLGIITSIIK